MNQKWDKTVTENLRAELLEELRAFEASSEEEYQVDEPTLSDLFPASEIEKTEYKMRVIYSDRDVQEWLNTNNLNMSVTSALVPGNSVEEKRHNRAMVFKKRRER